MLMNEYETKFFSEFSFGIGYVSRLCLSQRFCTCLIVAPESFLRLCNEINFKSLSMEALLRIFVEALCKRFLLI